MEEGMRWSLIVTAVVLLVLLVVEARGPKHYRGDEIGSHGTNVVVVVKPPG